MSSSGTRRFLSHSLFAHLIPDEKGTERIAIGQGLTLMYVATIAPMKRGLKVMSRFRNIWHLVVATIAAMKSGLKALYPPLVRLPQ